MPTTYSVSSTKFDTVTLAYNSLISDGAGMSMEEFAEMVAITEPRIIGISRQQISNFLNGKPVAHTAFVKICKVLGLKLEEIGLEFQPRPKENLHEANPGCKNFIEGDERLKAIHKLLLDRHKSTWVAITGMGGIGKTETAIQYVRNSNFSQIYQGGICWINAKSGRDGGKSIESQIKSFAINRAGVKPVLDAPEEFDYLSYYFDNWKEGFVLLVFDDIDELVNRENLPNLRLPSDPRFKVILTTRRKVEHPFIPFPVGVLSREGALDLLAIHIGDKIRISNEKEISNSLCYFLGDLPLGVELAGRYLQYSPDILISTYLKKLNLLSESRIAIQHESIVGVEAAFDVSWTSLNPETQATAIILGRYPEGADIHWSTIEEIREYYCDQYPELSGYDSNVLRLSQKQLLDFNLIKAKLSNNSIFTIHSLVREFFRSKTKNSEYENLRSFE